MRPLSNLPLFQTRPKPPENDARTLSQYLRTCEPRGQTASEIAQALSWGEGEQGKRRVRAAAEAAHNAISAPSRPYVHASRVTPEEYREYANAYMWQIKAMQRRKIRMDRRFYGVGLRLGFGLGEQGNNTGEEQ